MLGKLLAQVGRKRLVPRKERTSHARELPTSRNYAYPVTTLPWNLTGGSGCRVFLLLFFLGKGFPFEIGQQNWRPFSP